MTGYTLSRGGTRNETLDELVGRDRKYQEDVLQPGGATVAKKHRKSTTTTTTTRGTRKI